MSASREKNKRRGVEDTRIEKKLEQEAKQKKESQQFRNRAILVTVAFVFIAVIVVLFSSTALYGLTSVTCGDRSFNTADFNYYYATTSNNYYNQYYSQYGEYAQQMMPDAETLKQSALTSMAQMSMLAAEAEKEGYELSEEGQKTVDAAVQSIDLYAELYKMSPRRYLRNYYGGGVTKKVFQRNVEIATLASEYAAKVNDSFTYTDEELAAYYDESRDSYEYLTYDMYFVDGSAEDTSMEEAKATAEEFVSMLETGAAFGDVAYSISGNDERYADPSATNHTLTRAAVPDPYGEWLKDDARQEGDFDFVEAENGYYVVSYVSASDNNYATVDVRHILFSNDEISQLLQAEEMDEEAYEEQRSECHDLAQAFLDEWNAGDDQSEEAFAAFADEKSYDSPEGGLYEKVMKGQMDPGFESWCFDEPHAPGEVGICETVYGWHVMYFVDYDVSAENIIAENYLRSSDYSEWQSSNTEAYTAKTNFFFKALA